MKLKIEVKKIVVRGEKRFVITKLSGLARHELPTLYCAEKEAVFIDGEKLLSKRGWYRVDNGQTLTPEEMETLKEICGVAADLLQKTNKELEKENRGWRGDSIYRF